MVNWWLIIANEIFLFADGSCGPLLIINQFEVWYIGIFSSRSAAPFAYGGLQNRTIDQQKAAIKNVQQGNKKNADFDDKPPIRG